MLALVSSIYYSIYWLADCCQQIAFTILKKLSKKQFKKIPWKDPIKFYENSPIFRSKIRISEKGLYPGFPDSSRKYTPCLERHKYISVIKKLKLTLFIFIILIFRILCKSRNINSHLSIWPISLRSITA